MIWRMSFFDELKRRNVIRVAIAYAVAAWLMIEISATTFPMLQLPEWSATLVTVLLMIGLPVAIRVLVIFIPIFVLVEAYETTIYSVAITFIFVVSYYVYLAKKIRAVSS